MAGQLTAWKRSATNHTRLELGVDNQKEIHYARSNTLRSYDVRIEERSEPTIIELTGAIIRTSAMCVCGPTCCPSAASR